MSKHTPGPYYYALDKNNPDKYTNELWSNSLPSPHILTFNVAHPQAAENAEFVHRAMTSFDDLVAALEELLKPRALNVDGIMGQHNAEKMAYAALSKAKG
jgi:hypothetical protein